MDNDFKSATFLFEQAKSLLGLCLVYEKLPAEEKKNIQGSIKEWAKINARDGYAYYHLGLIALKEAKQNELAVKLFKESLQYPSTFWLEPSYPGKATYNLYKLLLDSNPEEAHKYLLEAAKFGNPRAALKLGLEYYTNEKLPQEERFAQAKKYFEIAQARPDARYNLALIAEYEKDYVKAKELFGQLVKEQYRDSAQRLKEVIKKQLEALKK